jgi:hypothetical protein
MGASWSVATFWLGEVDFEPNVLVLVVCRALSLAFGAFSLKKKSFVFRNSKSLSNATGSGVTFSTILGSSRAPWLETPSVRNIKNQGATANLIWLIKAGFELRVNGQSISPMHRTRVTEPQFCVRQSESKFLVND